MIFLNRFLSLRFFAAVLLCFSGIGAIGQTYDFQNFTTENGLSKSQILALFQGEEGEMWMGTNAGGVNRYNGAGFSYLNKENGLPDNTVFAFAKDKLGRLLIGTNNGLTVMNGIRIDTVTIAQGLTHEAIHSLHVAKNGTIWVGTRKGVCTLSGLKITPFLGDTNLLNSTVLNIREGADGGIWFCTVQHGLFRFEGGKLKQFSVESGLLRNYVYDAMPQQGGKAWIFGYDGLYHTQGDTAKLQTVAEVPKGTSFYTYQRDRSGNIWIGTSRGVLKFKDNSYTLLNESNGLVNNDIWKILQDREGNLWFGSKVNGVSKLNSERFKLFGLDSLTKQDVNAVLKDSKSRVWLGTKKGLVLWGDNKVQRVFKFSDGLSTEIVNDLKEDVSGNIFIATNYGLTIYDGKKLKAIESPDEILNECYTILLEDSNVWVGTKGGVARYENGKLEAVKEATTFRREVFHVCKLEDGIWFAYEDGLLHYDGKTFRQLKAKDGFTDGRTRSVINGPDGHLWFGNTDGVFKWDGKKLTRFDQNNGLMANGVNSLIFDTKGNLWVGQSKGLCKMTFSGDSLQSVIRYSREQGFLGLDCNTNSIMIDEDGVLWVGTSNGLISFDPRLDKGEYHKPLTRINEVKLYSQSVNWQLFTDSLTDTGLPRNLELDYDKNHLTFVFTGVSLTTPESINYIYFLKGFDDEWSPVSNNNEATYANLPPGSYTFMVRSGYGNEIWDNEAVEFSFTIKPPFYRTTWFYILIGLIAAGIAYSYYAIRRANVKITAQNAFIEGQKGEIEKKKDEIEKKNREMTDSINYASTIQSAILPSDELWFKLLPDSFVFFQPKDIVSGDFYWLESRDSEVFFSAVDCTGHGVPGALMSIIGNNGLNQAVNEHRLMNPAEILNYLSVSVNESLRKSERSNYVKDGMDLAFCRLNLQTRVLHYAGAYNPLVIIRNGELMVTKADRLAIGSMDNVEKSFINHELQLQPGDCVYVYSDGYADQFGGPLGKKLKSAPMLNKLAEISSLPMTKQGNELRKFFLEWKGQLEQVDDICIIGVRV